MKLVPRAWREGAVLVWRNLMTLMWLNLIWLALSLTVVLAGPATLAVYAFIATTMRADRDADLRLLAPLVRRAIVPGVLWFLTSAVVVAAVTLNVTNLPRVMGGVSGWTLTLVSLYAAWLYAALQPYLFEALTVRGESFTRAWGSALRGVASAPLLAHASVLLPVTLFVIASVFRGLGVIVLVAVVLAFAAAQVEPLTVRPEPTDDPPPEPEAHPARTQR